MTVSSHAHNVSSAETMNYEMHVSYYMDGGFAVVAVNEDIAAN